MVSESGLSAPRGGQGFTLVEVLISMALFAVALTLLLGGFRFTSKAWEAGEKVTARTSELETVHRVFGNMLERLFPVSLPVMESEGYAFSGTGKRLRFAAQLPPYPGVGGLYSVEFAIFSGNDLDRLVLKIAPFDAKTFHDIELKSDEKSLLLETTGRLSFSYYGISIAEQWLTEWPELEAPPQTIRLQFQDTEEPWPEIVAPVSIDMDLACAFPALGGECRLDR
jgi:prepilin-type N-terminal cleavage/methylation domain-containing protein